MGVIQRTRSYGFGASSATATFSDINQATVNEYNPGQGIGSHIDTTSAFGDGLISISFEWRDSDGISSAWIGR